MTAERSEASDMFARQKHERKQFFLNQARRLNDADFNWELPEEFRLRHVYMGPGLVVEEKSEDELRHGEHSIILYPQRGLVYLNGSGQITDYPTDIQTPWEIFQKVEGRVTEALANLQAAKVPA